MPKKTIEDATKSKGTTKKVKAKPSAGDKPAKTTEKSTKTTAKSTKTTAKSTKTTAKSAKTAAKPIKTTAKPAKTTAKPAKTTAKPAKTTAKSAKKVAEPKFTSVDTLVPKQRKSKTVDFGFDTRFSLRMPSELNYELAGIASIKGITKSELVREILFKTPKADYYAYLLELRPKNGAPSYTNVEILCTRSERDTFAGFAKRCGRSMNEVAICMLSDWLRRFKNA